MRLSRNANISIALSSPKASEEIVMHELARASCFQKYEFNAPLKVSARRVDNLLLANKHLSFTIDFRNKECARVLHLNGFLVS